EHHAVLAKEFKEEVELYGRIYMYRYMPDYPISARRLNDFPHQSKQAAAIMLMISNNLDRAIAQHPDELITYGGNGAVFQNWAQYRLTMQYLATMTDEQTLVLYSGHPMGLFPSHKEAPRAVITNGMVIPNYSGQDDYERMNTLGVSQYGQMTAGSFMYIGPQGIVHGTTITVLNAGRMLGISSERGLTGKLFVTSGLGGMSGAQPKATVIAGGVCLVAEVNRYALDKRKSQGWVDEAYDSKEQAIGRAVEAKKSGEAVSIAYHGNIVDLWEALDKLGVQVELGSDQTSLHNPFSGGYYPAGMSFEEANELMHAEPGKFKEAVEKSLRRHVDAINRLAGRGMFFWDYGNAFLLESGRAGADVFNASGDFKYKSYVQAIMGPKFFDYGFGPFRWVCSSSDPSDLNTTDQIAAEVLEKIAISVSADIKDQLEDNIHWIREAGRNNLVVGSQARILYADSEGRIKIALAFNRAIREGKISGPVILGRDHHDVSGTDSPYRETSNIYDGSAFTADMAIHNVIGDAFRGATWVSVHNGGGVGWGEVINGGFGMVLDGSEEADVRISQMLHWDVNNGIARRSWARNEEAITAIKREMEHTKNLRVTLPYFTDEQLIGRIFGE
ncbi:MAG TPA: urocanate hydratase, partial [Bacteroidales bacterium]|nr:urocanate hydratase [Bacteroidales bacterium]